MYSEMQEAYRKVADAGGLSCEGCGQNCCTSFFRHHTLVEWSYLWKGLMTLPEERRGLFIARARDYVDECRKALDARQVPTAMCPLNEGGLCALYDYRLMICRLHGTRNFLARPDGERLEFRGCWRFAELHPENEQAPALDRTPFSRALAGLEMEFLKRHKMGPQKIDLTLAEMILAGPPRIRQ